MRVLVNNKEFTGEEEFNDSQALSFILFNLLKDASDECIDKIIEELEELEDESSFKFEISIPNGDIVYDISILYKSDIDCFVLNIVDVKDHTVYEFITKDDSWSYIDPIYRAQKYLYCKKLPKVKYSIYAADMIYKRALKSPLGTLLEIKKFVTRERNLVKIGNCDMLSYNGEELTLVDKSNRNVFTENIKSDEQLAELFEPWLDILIDNAR